MPKLGRTTGPSVAGVRTHKPNPSVLLEGDRIRVLDGAIEFFASETALTADLRLYRNADGSLGATAFQNNQPWVFDTTQAPYNIDKTGQTDGTAALMTAVNDAAAWAIANSSPFAVVRGEGITKLSSATTKGGSTLGNAQIPLPVRDQTLSKVTIVLQGPTPAADSLLHWNQTVAQVQPWTLQSTLTGLNTDGAWGPPSVIGGPAVSGSSATYGSATGLFNNINVVLDNVGIVVPLDPTIMGFDLRSCAEAHITTASVLANGTPAQLSARQGSGYTRSYSSGLLLPANLNNDRITVTSFSCEGCYTGFSMTEHTSILAGRSIYCHDGIYVQADGNGNHSSTILNASVEASNQGIYTDGGANPPVGFFCGMLDTEGLTTHISDHNNALGGTVWWNDNNNSTLAPTVDNAANLQIIATRRTRGAVTAPGVPSTTVALVNPFYRDAAVNITGGSVTVIKVDAVTTGLTSGTVIVPSGKSVAITYTVAPTWVWTLL